MYCMSLVVGQDFPFQNNLKDLDPSCKMDLDLNNLKDLDPSCKMDLDLWDYFRFWK